MVDDQLLTGRGADVEGLDPQSHLAHLRMEEALACQTLPACLVPLPHLDELGAATALPLLLSGCGSDDSKPKAAPTVTATVTASPTVTESASPSAVAPNTGTSALKVGQWREGRDVRTRVRSLIQPSDTRSPSYLKGESDAEGALADVEMCVRKSTTYVMKGDLYGSFNVYDKDGGQYSQASSSWDEWPPRPQFPSTAVTVTPGRCVRGWILFSVPRNERVRSIVNDGQGDATAEWLTG